MDVAVDFDGRHAGSRPRLGQRAWRESQKNLYAAQENRAEMRTAQRQLHSRDRGMQASKSTDLGTLATCPTTKPRRY